MLRSVASSSPFPPELSPAEVNKDHPMRRGRLLTQSCSSKGSATITLLGRLKAGKGGRLHGGQREAQVLRWGVWGG